MSIRLALQDVTTIAREVVAAEHPALEVIGTLNGGVENSYAEVVLTLLGCHREPCRIVLGVDRNLSPTEARSVLAKQIEEHLEALTTH